MTTSDEGFDFSTAFNIDADPDNADWIRIVGRHRRQGCGEVIAALNASMPLTPLSEQQRESLESAILRSELQPEVMREFAGALDRLADEDFERHQLEGVDLASIPGVEMRKNRRHAVVRPTDIAGARWAVRMWVGDGNATHEFFDYQTDATRRAEDFLEGRL